MSYRLRVNNQFLDLFPNQEISIGADYYDTTSVDAIKIPFTFNTTVPYTSKNINVLGYDATSSYSGIPLTEYSYEVYNESTLLSSGKARILSVIINSVEPIFELELKDKVSEFSRLLRDLKFEDIYNDSFSTQVRTLSTYLTSNEGYNQRDIEIPFIDVDNVQKTSGYESRQFTSWGTSGKKFGLFPALRVVDFIDRVFSATGVSYTSNFTLGTGSVDASDLYILYPTYLSAEPGSKRESLLFPFPYNVQSNTDQELFIPVEVNGNEWTTIGVDNYKLIAKETYEPFGPTNYSPTEAIVSREYGDQLRKSSGVTDWGDENVGYVSYGSSFDAKFSFISNTVSVSGLKTCLFSLDGDYDGQIIPEFIENFTLTSGAEFKPYVLIYESYTTSSQPTYKIPLIDENGDQIVLDILSISINSDPLDFIDETSVGNQTTTFLFDDFTASIDDTIAYTINGGSTYSYAIGVYMEGSIICTTASKGYNQDNLAFLFNTKFNRTIGQNDIVKQRTFGYDWSILGLKVDNIGNLAATVPNDNFQFKRSLMNNTSISVYDLFVDVVKRFGLSLVYDYQSGDIILDNLKDVRLTTSSFDSYMDTLKPYEVSAGTKPPKTLKLLNKNNDGLYDKFENGLAIGSFDGVFNVNGVGEQSVEFITSLINPINKTICLDVLEIDPILLNNGLVSVNEIGDIKNQIPDYDKVGLRIFYLKNPDNTTTLRYPVFRQYNDYGQKIRQVVYKPFGPVRLQGYPIISGTGNQKDLRFAFEDGTLGDSYNYLVTSERFVANEKNKMSFYAAIPESVFQNGDIYKNKFRFDKTSESFIVNTLDDAKIYDGYVYGKFEIIFVD
jgi:hypothetical protein